MANVNKGKLFVAKGKEGIMITFASWDELYQKLSHFLGVPRKEVTTEEAAYKDVRGLISRMETMGKDYDFFREIPKPIAK